MQGLLLQPVGVVKNLLPKAAPYVEKLRVFCQLHEIPVESFLAGIVAFRSKKAKILFGVDTHSQLEQNLNRYHNCGFIETNLYTEWEEVLGSVPKSIINPSLWDEDESH